MCESNIYVADHGVPDEQAELFLEAVDEILPESEGVWRVTSIFGEQKLITGQIRSMHLVDHRIIFDRN
jgi:predicted RNA-binding protein